MPVWATLGRLEDATPAFDVYTIGKVIWGMVLGENRLPFKYGYDGRFDLNTSVCSAEEVPWLQRIVRETVVESPAEAVQNAGELLPMINIAIEALTSGYQDVKVPDRRCRVCGRGRYEKLVDLDAGRQANFGLNVISQPRFKIFICSYCAHVQQFYFRDGLTPQAWA